LENQGNQSKDSKGIIVEEIRKKWTEIEIKRYREGEAVRGQDEKKGVVNRLDELE